MGWQLQSLLRAFPFVVTVAPRQLVTVQRFAGDPDSGALVTGQRSLIHIMSWSTESQECVFERRRPFSAAHRSRRDTASCSCLDTERVLEAEYQMARSSTSRDMPTAAGCASLMSFIITAKRATLMTPPWGTPLSCKLQGGTGKVVSHANSKIAMGQDICIYAICVPAAQYTNVFTFHFVANAPGFISPIRFL